MHACNKQNITKHILRKTKQNQKTKTKHKDKQADKEQSNRALSSNSSPLIACTLFNIILGVAYKNRKKIKCIKQTSKQKQKEKNKDVRVFVCMVINTIISDRKQKQKQKYQT